MIKDPAFTVGIEEEYLLIDKETRRLTVDPPEELFAECEKKIPGLVKPEFLKSQIEVNTKICKTVAQARKNLALLRHTVADIVGNYNQFWFAPGNKVSETKQPSLVVDPSNGRVPPLIPPAAATVEVLICDDKDDARRLAGRMEELNRTRKELQSTLSAEVLATARELGPTSQDPGACLAGEGWHQGRVGIVAARVAAGARRAFHPVRVRAGGGGRRPPDGRARK